jgi:hypothetical protein
MSFLSPRLRFRVRVEVKVRDRVRFTTLEVPDSNRIVAKATHSAVALSKGFFPYLGVLGGGAGGRVGVELVLGLGLEKGIESTLARRTEFTCRVTSPGLEGWVEVRVRVRVMVREARYLCDSRTLSIAGTIRVPGWWFL